MSVLQGIGHLLMPREITFSGLMLMTFYLVIKYLNNLERPIAARTPEYYSHQRGANEKARFITSSLWQDLLPVEWFLAKFTDNVWMNPASWLISRRLVDLAGPWNELLVRDNDGEYICKGCVI